MDEPKTRSVEIQAIVLTTMLFVLPAVNHGFDGLRIIVPLVPFYFSLAQGEQTARKTIGLALLAGALISGILGNFSSILYAFFLLPAGFSLVASSKRQLHPVWAGAITTLLILMAWAFGGILYWLATQGNPYIDALTALDKAFDNVAASYQSQKLAPDVAREINRAINQARVTVPRLFPAILVISALVVTWLNMVIGNNLLKKNVNQAPWPAYRFWRLPENLVWLLIVAGIGIIIFQGSSSLFIDMLLILISLYVMQGRAVMQAMFVRWKVPTLARIFIYVICVLQTFSVLLLAVLGIIDVWKDLGKIYPEIEQN